MYDDEKLFINGITYSSAVDGTGFRDVLFVNYCPHRCPDCHNPQTWDRKNGVETTVGEVYKNLTESSVTNITFSGGEPFEQSAALTKLARLIREKTDKTIWVYSGYLFETLMADEEKRGLLMLCDVLVDGCFDKALAKLNSRFKGSENQRIIDIKKSVEQNKVVLFDLDF